MIYQRCPLCDQEVRCSLCDRNDCRDAYWCHISDYHGIDLESEEGDCTVCGNSTRELGVVEHYATCHDELTDEQWMLLVLASQAL